MFSGIVERTAEVVSIRTDRQNKDFTLRADFCKELKIDQSIAHNGVCLTVVDITEDTYTVTAMKETLDRSNLGLLREGDLVNLERSMKPDALLDGHSHDTYHVEMRNKARETVLRQGCGTKMEGIGYLKIAAKDGAMEAGGMMWNNDDFNATQLYQLDTDVTKAVAEATETLNVPFQ